MIDIQLNTEGLNRAAQTMRRWRGNVHGQGEVEAGLRKVLKTAERHLKSNYVSAIRERYAMTPANIKGGALVKVIYSHRDGIQMTVRFSGRRMTLYKFSGVSPATPTCDARRRIPVNMGDRWRLVHPGVPTLAHVLQGTAPTYIENAFVARMKSLHVGIFRRDGESRLPAHELYAPSIPQMLDAQEVATRLVNETEARASEALEREIMRFMNGG